jgi:hypothetical protein
MLSKYKRRNEKVDPNKRQIKLQQIEILLRSKYSFQAEIDQSSKTFYKKEFLPIINQLKTECIDIFSDYILHPKTKLRNNDDEVNLAIQSLKNQIEVIKNKHSKNIEIKLENLKAKIIVIINKVNKLIYDTEAQLANFRVINDIKGERVLELDDIAGPLMLGVGGYLGGIGFLVGLGVEGVAGGAAAGAIFGAAGLGICLISGLIGFGIYKIYKAVNKDDDLVELVKKGEKKFFSDIDDYCSKFKINLDSYKNKVISELNKYIENYVYELKKSLDSLNH